MVESGSPNHKTGLKNLIAAFLLVMVTLVAYVPAIRGGFIWDDDDYVTKNAALNDLAGLVSIWLDPSATPQYYPLVHSSFWIENQLWGHTAAGYHIVNVLIHCINALLLWRVLVWLGAPGPWLVAMIFAIHPVHVESVAWITERKNVLSGFFYLSAAICFLKHWDFAKPESSFPEDKHTDRKWYFTALACFVGAMLSKTVAATFPAALLVMVWWKRGTIEVKNVVKLAPFFVIGISMGLLTVWLEKTQVGAEGIDWDLSMVERVLIAGRVLWFYAGKLVWPMPLIFTYHRWDIDTSQIWQFAFPIAAVAVMVGLWAVRNRIGRGPLAAVLFFAGTLFPALGFFDVYPMRFSFVADHFQYMASIGVIALVVAAAHRVLGQGVGGEFQWRSAKVFAGAIVLFLAALTWNQGKIYEGVEVLWRDTLAKNPTSFMAHSNLGAILNRRGEFAEAESHLRQAVEIKPKFAESWLNLGKAREGQGDLEEAIEYYTRATTENTALAAAWNGLGAAQGMKGDFAASEGSLLKALELDPNFAMAHSNMATLYAAQGKLAEAATGYREAVRLDGSLIQVRENLARVLTGLKQTDESMLVWKDVLERQPDNTNAMLNLGIIAAGDGRNRTALNYFKDVIEIEPGNVKAIYNAGAMSEQLGEAVQARRYFEKFEALRPSTKP